MALLFTPIILSRILFKALIKQIAGEGMQAKSNSRRRSILASGKSNADSFNRETRYEELINKLKTYMSENDQEVLYKDMWIDSQRSVSRVLTDFPYLIGDSTTDESIPEADNIKVTLEQNFEQFRQIFFYYVGNQKTIKYQECKAMITDFGLLPRMIDINTFNQLYRSTLLWEWQNGECVRNAVNFKNKIDCGVSIASDESSIRLQLAAQDPKNFRHFMITPALTFEGFIELVCRISVATNKRCSARQALENMMHVMDMSGGVHKLLTSYNRRSLSVRRFVYAMK